MRLPLDGFTPRRGSNRSPHGVRSSRARAISWILGLAFLAGAARADELHLRNGAVLYGRLKSESKSSYKFLETGKKRTSSVRKSRVERVLLTYALPDFVYTDPKWSPEMVSARQDQTFEKGWGKVEVLRSRHYIIFTNSSAGKLYIDTMEDVYAHFRKVFPFEEPDKAFLLPIFLFKMPDQYYSFYADIAHISVPAAKRSKGHAWRDYYATYYEAPKDPVHYHEGAHQLVFNRLRLTGGGSWFQEGLAVYFEGTIFPGRDPAKGMKAKVKQNQHTPFEVMISLRSLLQSSESGTLARERYQQAGAMIKALAEGPMREKFPDLLDEVRTGRSWPEIFKTVYDKTIPEMEQAFVEFYRR